MSLTGVLSSLGRPVAYYPKLAKFTKSLNAAVFLSQFLYWHGLGYDGEIFKTQAEIEDETGLRPEEQRTAVRALVDMGILTVVKKGLPARNFYQFDWKKLDTLWSQYVQNYPYKGCGQSPRTPTTSRRESPPLDGENADYQSSRKSTTGRGESPPLDGEKVHDIKRKKETTQETTQETTTTTQHCASSVVVCAGAEKQPNLDPPPASQPTAQQGATPAGQMAVALRNAGVGVTSIHPVLLAWVAAGLTTEFLLECVALARIEKPAPMKIPARYLDSIAAAQQRAQPARDSPGSATHGTRTARSNKNTKAPLDESHRQYPEMQRFSLPDVAEFSRIRGANRGRVDESADGAGNGTAGDFTAAG